MLDNILKWFEKYKKQFIVFSFILLILLLIVSIRGCMNNSISKNNLKIVNDSLNMKIVNFTDKNNNIHSQVKELQITNKELNTVNSNLKSYYDFKLDSLSKVLKIREKQIHTYLTIISSSTGEGFGKVDTLYDTVLLPNKPLSYYSVASDDGYLKYNGILKEGNFSYKYSYIDSLNVIRFYKKKGLLGWRKEYYWDVSSYNKNSKIIGLEQFSKVTNNKYKIFSVVVGPNISLSTDLKPKILPISITIGIKLIEF